LGPALVALAVQSAISLKYEENLYRFTTQSRLISLWNGMVWNVWQLFDGFTAAQSRKSRTFIDLGGIQSAAFGHKVAKVNVIRTPYLMPVSEPL